MNHALPEYPPYYATFWLDRFGIMPGAVCHDDRDRKPPSWERTMGNDERSGRIP
jgi:hypothetical protein